MKIKNFLDGVTKGKGQTYRISKANLRTLVPEIKKEHRMFNFDKTESNLKILEKYNLDTSLHTKIEGEIRFKGYRSIHSNLPNISICFNGNSVDGDFVRQGQDLSDWDSFLINDGSGRLVSLIYDLSERDCSIELPAILAYTPDKGVHRHTDWYIYVDFPKYFELKEELRTIGAY